MADDKFHTLLTNINNLFKQKFEDYISIQPDICYNYTLEDFEANLNKTNIK
jgi:hypothetical protein